MTNSTEIAPETGRPKVFISYSRKDLAFANQLGDSLTSMGFILLIDRNDIYAFEDWWKRVEALIAQADTMVFIVSPESMISPVCRREISFALSLNKRLAPIVYQRVDVTELPPDIARLNFIYFDEPNAFNESMARLVDALNTDIEWIRLHTDYGERARRWKEFGHKGPRGLLRASEIAEAERWIASRPRGAPPPTQQAQDFVIESRRFDTRRRNLAIIGAFLVALVAAALAGLAWYQRDEAQRNYEAARHAADGLVIDLATAIEDVEGIRLETRRVMLDRAEKTYERISRGLGTDPALLVGQARMYRRFSTLYAKAGDVHRQIESANRALTIVQRLVEKNPNDGHLQGDLMASYDAVGEARLAKGDLAGALTSYQDAMALNEKLVAASPAGEHWQDRLATSLARIGGVLERQGQFAKALAAYERALVIRERANSRMPNRLAHQISLSITHDKVGDIAEAQGDLARALKAYQESQRLRERLADAYPDNTQVRLGLSVSHDKVGNVLMAQRNLDGALQQFKHALAAAQRLATRDPDNVDWQEGVATSLDKIGNAFQAQKNGSEALKAYEEALAIRKRLPDSAGKLQSLSVSYHKIGRSREAQDEHERALTSYLNGVAMGERLVTIDPANGSWQRGLSVGYNDAGDVLRELGRRAEALQFYRKSLKIREELAARSADYAEPQIDLVIVNMRLAEMGDDSHARWQAIANILRRLDGLGRLSDRRRALLHRAERELTIGRPRTSGGEP